MSDGVRLATDVYLPAGGAACEAVLVRLPYDKSGRYTFMPTAAPWFTERGYALVVQDVRGKFRSEGETIPYQHEVSDGYDTIDWITRQSWCNGVVGMFGDSYYGWTQWAAVASGHPALRAIVPRVTSAELGTIRVETRWDRGVVPLYGASYFARHWTAHVDYEWDIDWSVRPLNRVFEEMFAQVGSRAVAFDRMLAPGGSVSPFAHGHPFQAREVPALHCVGWFDNIGPDSMRDYMTLGALGRSLQYLDANAFDHENYVLEETPVDVEGDHDVNDDALQRMLPIYLGPALDFFDCFLKGTGDEPARVRWRAGHGEPREGETWPPAEARRWRLYLGDAVRAVTTAAGGTLASVAPARESSARWRHDGDDLVPSTVKNPFALLYEHPDEAPVQARDDVASFTTEALQSATEIAGPVVARPAIGAGAPTTQVYVKLSDVAPDGTALMVARGQSYVFDASHEAPVSVYLGHLAHVLEPGHRLRLHVASSDFPLYLPLFGDGGDPWQARRGSSVTQSLRVGGAVASHLDLDVLAGAPR